MKIKASILSVITLMLAIYNIAITRALSISGWVIVPEPGDITSATERAGKALQSWFWVLDFLWVLALIVGWGFVLKFILWLIPKALSWGK